MVRPIRGKSSGVGMFISRRLHRSGFHFYQVKKSLITLTAEHGKSQLQNQSNIADKLPHGKRLIYITDTRDLKR